MNDYQRLVTQWREREQTLCRQAPLSKIAEMWRNAERGGRRAAESLAANGAYEAAAYERGKADARGFCAESLEALGSGEARTAPEPKQR